MTGSSSKKKLSTNARRCFQSGFEDWFVFTTERGLGSLESVTIWHDNTGKSPHWYISIFLALLAKSHRQLCFYTPYEILTTLTSKHVKILLEKENKLVTNVICFSIYVFYLCTLKNCHLSHVLISFLKGFQFRQAQNFTSFKVYP